MRIDRIEKIISNMKKYQLDQLVISSPSSMYYLSEQRINSGERLYAAYIDIYGTVYFFVNRLFTEFAEKSENIVWYSDTDDAIGIVADKINKNSRVGLDKNWPAHFVLELMAKKEADYVIGSQAVDEVRMIKDNLEIQKMRNTCITNQGAMSKLISCIKENITEIYLKTVLSQYYNENGADGYDIRPIISFGANCANAHHTPEEIFIKSGDCVMMDIGATKDGYRSDMTRTVFYQKPNSQLQEIYKLVAEAQQKAFEVIKPGIRFCDIDNAARSIIEKNGYGKYFNHRLGHGIGIDGHEFPSVSADNTQIVQTGMVFSVEPGIYIPGCGGVRIEDLVVVNKEGYENLYTLSKEQQIID